MTNEEARAIGERLTKCDGFRWLPGMLCLPFKTDDPAWPDGAGGDVRFRVGALSDDGDPLVADLFGHVASSDALDPLPDLRDPCTLGGLLALVREAWGNHLVWCQPYYRDREPGEEWNVYCETTTHGPTEASALVAALEAAPSKGQHERPRKRPRNRLARTRRGARLRRMVRRDPGRGRDRRRNCRAPVGAASGVARVGAAPVPHHHRGAVGRVTARRCCTCQHWRPATPSPLRAPCAIRLGRVVARTSREYRCSDWTRSELEALRREVERLRETIAKLTGAR